MNKGNGHSFLISRLGPHVAAHILSIQRVNTGSVSEDQPALLFSRTLAALGFSKSDAGRETMRHGHEAQSRAPMVFLTPSSITLAGLGGKTFHVAHKGP